MIQQRKAADEKNGFPSYSRMIYDDCYISGNMDIISYQNALKYLDDPTNATIGRVTTVVFDEVHFFLADSTFNSSTSVIFQRLLKRFVLCKRIYMSATPESVEKIISLEELRAYINYRYFGGRLVAGRTSRSAEANRDTLNTYSSYPTLLTRVSKTDEILEIYAAIYGPLPADLPYITKYKFASNFDHVILHFFHNWSDIEQTIHETGSDDKWLIFVREKSTGESVQKDIGKESLFLSADRNNNEDEKYHDIIRENRFDQKVLISTAILYNGVSFKDDKFKHIVVDSVNREEIIQMLGRKRCKDGEYVNLYIKIPTEKELTKYLVAANAKLEHIKTFLRDRKTLLRMNGGKITLTII